MPSCTELKRQAREEADAGRLGIALETYRRAARALEASGRPHDPLLDVRMADLHHRLGHERMAVSAYGRAADGYREEGRAANAIAVWKRVLRLYPDHVWVNRELGDIHLEQGLVAEARRHVLAFVQAADERGEPAAAVEALEAFLGVREDEEVDHVLRAYRALQRGTADPAAGGGEAAAPESGTGAGGETLPPEPGASRPPVRDARRLLPAPFRPAPARAAG
ncbi:MAG TPA: tetratricopeptide repeat protein [Gemmatimonadota bacterium]|nr:tetratricopeptide repeat protein [Gemmatimonadota bacterium]